METVALTIDGKSVTVEKGKTVLQAAIESGIKVPYYCYHPGLGIDGSCRVCLVKIEKMPKLQVSCSVVAAEGMVVQTETPEVVQARAGVFEFLLINHPLDCPVCDKGGECPLQDFSYAFGPKGSRMEFARRVFDGEGVRADVDFGPTLMLNRNRCILCTRCVRFMRDVDGDAQIGIADRGYGSEIATFKEEGVHSLLSGNLMDVCPVGAITTREYRFKSRPWDNPTAVDTICTLCEKGCNTTVWLKAKPEWAKGAQLARITPRYNPEVNGYWMCDIGRFRLAWIESEARLSQPLVREGNDAQTATTWDHALDTLKRLVGAHGSEHLRFLLSAHASHEEMFALSRLARQLLGDRAQQSCTVSWAASVKSQPEHTTFSVPPIDAPNVAGARLLGLTSVPVGEAEPDLSALRAAVEAGEVRVLYVLDPGPSGSLGDTAWIVDARQSGRIASLVLQGVLESPLAAAADVVLPGACFVEKEACYTNGQGRLQATARAIPPPGQALDDCSIIVRVAAALGRPLDYRSAADIRADIAATRSDEPGLQGIADMAFAQPVATHHWLEASNPMERWKWDVMFQDLPPVKFEEMLKK
ncbi:MAG: molybdopterin-dependent oxidoreductase [Luteitalea sp.]|nr:molybdopterin-dependent oxidoreductase [Luteitalea sp.]